MVAFGSFLDFIPRKTSDIQTLEDNTEHNNYQFYLRIYWGDRYIPVLLVRLSDHCRTIYSSFKLMTFL